GSCGTVLAPSTATIDLLAADGYARERLQVWSRGVNTSAFSPARRSAELRLLWNVNDKKPAVLYAGRLSREEGLGLLPGIVSNLAGRCLKYRLVFAGDGPMRAELQQRFPDAVFLGEVPHGDMGKIMASADMMLFPSATDTFGNVVLEAQSSGLPVV